VDSVKTKIINNNYSKYGVRVDKMINRMIKYAPQYSLEGLNEIIILDKDPNNRGFARYFKEEGKIELYVSDIVGWQPCLFKKSYIFPYLTLGMALGHELDHDVRRHENVSNEDLERSAEANALKYIYPSFGVFKPFVRGIAYVARYIKANRKGQ
jgi:hypothetical protein